jgi:hypothetical protein
MQGSWTNVTRRSISQSLASLENLKALCLFANEFENEDLMPLAGIKNLKHLSWQGSDMWMNVTGKANVIQSVLQNSMSTLQSLTIETNYFGGQFLKNWKNNLKTTIGKKTTGTSDDGYDFTALKSLALSGMEVDEDHTQELHKAIDFMRLRELTLASLTDPHCVFFPHLTSLATSYRGTTDIPMSLRTLSLDMSDNYMTHSTEQQIALFKSKCQFISSFETLTTLVLHEYGMYPSRASFANHGLLELLLQAILKHKNLRVLRMPYRGTIQGQEILYLRAKTVGIIVDSLPQLREFEFAPDEEQMDEISQVLLRGSSHLESITCFPHASWTIRSPDHQPGLNILSSILLAFLSNNKINLTPTSSNGKFRWEEHYKLNQVSVVYNRWDIASKFRKPGRGGMQPTNIKADEADGTREVYYQAKRPRPIHVGYDDEFEWVAKVERQMH